MTDQDAETAADAELADESGDQDEELSEELVEGAPEPPKDVVLDPDDPRTALQKRLRRVLLNLPASFRFDNHIAGIEATDLHNLNTLLGASIEVQVVKLLNAQRDLWDIDGTWSGYVFERQSQAFPDVRLVRREAGGKIDVVLGIELKGWFLMAKEGKPSFRFAETPAACADHDLLCVVPWYLDNVLSGNPIAAEPFVESARWAAEFRNYYWQFSRDAAAGADRAVVAPPNAKPYPIKSEAVLDKAVDDSGSNFGRVARSPGLMAPWVARTNQTLALGIPIRDWCSFLKRHRDNADPDVIAAALEKDVRKTLTRTAKKRAPAIVDAVWSLVNAYTGEDA